MANKHAVLHYLHAQARESTQFMRWALNSEKFRIAATTYQSIDVVCLDAIPKVDC